MSETNQLNLKRFPVEFLTFSVAVELGFFYEGFSGLFISYTRMHMHTYILPMVSHCSTK